MYLVKTDSQGKKIWSKTFGGARWDGAKSIIQTKDGGFAIAGYTYSFGAGKVDMYLVKTDSKGKKMWSQTFGGANRDIAYSIIQTKDGGFAIAGLTDSFGEGERDMYLILLQSVDNK